jgi:hypothetical protein
VAVGEDKRREISLEHLRVDQWAPRFTMAKKVQRMLACVALLACGQERKPQLISPRRQMRQGKGEFSRPNLPRIPSPRFDRIDEAGPGLPVLSLAGHAQRQVVLSHTVVWRHDSALGEDLLAKNAVPQTGNAAKSVCAHRLAFFLPSTPSWLMRTITGV